MVHLKTMVTLPHFSGDFTPGSYELLLYLPDAMLNKTACALKGCDSSDFAIRFANENVWDVEPKPTGLNRLNARISIQ